MAEPRKSEIIDKPLDVSQIAKSQLAQSKFFKKEFNPKLQQQENLLGSSIKNFLETSSMKMVPASLMKQITMIQQIKRSDAQLDKSKSVHAPPIVQKLDVSQIFTQNPISQQDPADTQNQEHQLKNLTTILQKQETIVESKLQPNGQNGTLFVERDIMFGYTKQVVEPEKNKQMDQFERFLASATQDARWKKAARLFKDAELGRKVRMDFQDGNQKQNQFFLYQWYWSPYWHFWLLLLTMIYLIQTFFEPANASDKIQIDSEILLWLEIQEGVILIFFFIDTCLTTLEKDTQGYTGCSQFFRVCNFQFIIKATMIILEVSDAINYYTRKQDHLKAEDGDGLRFITILRPVWCTFYSQEMRVTLISIFQSLQYVFEIFVFFFIFSLFWGYMGWELFKGSTDGDSIYQIHNEFNEFGTSCVAMYSLTSLDNYPDIFLSLLDNNSNYWPLIFFIPYTLIVIFVILPIPVAVIFQSYKEQRALIMLEERINIRQALIMCFICIESRSSEESSRITYDAFFKLLNLQNIQEKKKILSQTKFFIISASILSSILPKFNNFHFLRHYNQRAIPDRCLKFFQVLDIRNEGYLEIDDFQDIYDLIQVSERLYDNSNQIWDAIRYFCNQFFFFETISHSSIWNGTILLMVLVNTGLIIAYGLVYDEDVLAVFDEIDTYFNYIYLGDVVIQIIGEGVQQYFKDTWHQFDFFMGIITIGTQIGLEYLKFLKRAKSGQLLQLTKVQRTMRIFRSVRSVKMFKFLYFGKAIVNRIQNLLFKILYCFPVVVQVFLSMFFLFYIYAIIGMILFNSQTNLVRPNSPYSLEQYTSFDSFGFALISLFQVCTESGWVNEMYDNAFQFNFTDAFIYFITFHSLIIFFMISLLKGLVWDMFNVVEKRFQQEQYDQNEEVLNQFFGSGDVEQQIKQAKKQGILFGNDDNDPKRIVRKSIYQSSGKATRNLHTIIGANQQPISPNQQKPTFKPLNSSENNNLVSNNISIQAQSPFKQSERRGKEATLLGKNLYSSSSSDDNNDDSDSSDSLNSHEKQEKNDVNNKPKQVFNQYQSLDFKSLDNYAIKHSNKTIHQESSLGEEIKEVDEGLDQLASHQLEVSKYDYEDGPSLNPSNQDCAKSSNIYLYQNDKFEQISHELFTPREIGYDKTIEILCEIEKQGFVKPPVLTQEGAQKKKQVENMYRSVTLQRIKESTIAVQQDQKADILQKLYQKIENYFSEKVQELTDLKNNILKHSPEAMKKLSISENFYFINERGDSMQISQIKDHLSIVDSEMETQDTLVIQKKKNQDAQQKQKNKILSRISVGNSYSLVQKTFLGNIHEKNLQQYEQNLFVNQFGIMYEKLQQVNMQHSFTLQNNINMSIQRLLRYSSIENDFFLKQMHHFEFTFSRKLMKKSSFLRFIFRCGDHWFCMQRVDKDQYIQFTKLTTSVWNSYTKLIQQEGQIYYADDIFRKTPNPTNKPKTFNHIGVFNHLEKQNEEIEIEDEQIISMLLDDCEYLGEQFSNFQQVRNGTQFKNTKFVLMGFQIVNKNSRDVLNQVLKLNEIEEEKQTFTNLDQSTFLRDQEENLLTLQKSVVTEFHVITLNVKTNQINQTPSVVKQQNSIDKGNQQKSSQSLIQSNKQIDIEINGVPTDDQIKHFQLPAIVQSLQDYRDIFMVYRENLIFKFSEAKFLQNIQKKLVKEKQKLSKSSQQSGSENN